MIPHVNLDLPWDLSARERRAADLGAAMAREFAPATAANDRSGRFPLEHYARLHECGYLRLALPRDYGGDGAGLLEMVLAQEQLAQGDAASAVGVGMLLNVLGRLAEEPLWPEPVFAEVCRAIARDGGLVNAVVTEPALGSISRGGVPATMARPVAGGWLVSGHKIFVTAAPALRFLLVAVQLPPSATAPHGEVARAIVEAPARGLRIEPAWADALAQRSGGSDEAFFDEVFVPAERLVERQPIGGPSVSGARRRLHPRPHPRKHPRQHPRPTPGGSRLWPCISVWRKRRCLQPPTTPTTARLRFWGGRSRSSRMCSSGSAKCRLRCWPHGHFCTTWQGAGSAAPPSVPRWDRPSPLRSSSLPTPPAASPNLG